MQSIILLAGAHASGKTTLATALAERTRTPFFPSKSSAIHAAHGVMGGDDIPFGQRCKVQLAIYTAFCDDFIVALDGNQGGVFDRTPIDFAAYLLADVRRSMRQDEIALVERYVAGCIDQLVSVAIPSGAKIFMVERLPQIEDRGLGKPPANPAYARLIETLITGILIDHSIPHEFIPAGSIEDRISCAGSHMNQWFDESIGAAAKDKALRHHA